MPTTWGLGYSLGLITHPGHLTAFGVGGSFAYGDTVTGVAFGSTENRLAADFGSATELVRLITEALC